MHENYVVPRAIRLGPQWGPIGEITALPRPFYCLPFHQKSHRGWPSPIIRSALSILQSWTSALPSHFSHQFLRRIDASGAHVLFFSRATAKFEVPFHCGSVFIKAVVTSMIRLLCDCNSTARYDHSTTCVTTVGLLVVGCCTLRLT